MKRARGAIYWLVPLLICLALYRHGLRAWFQMDDFAWLLIRRDVYNWHTFLQQMFGPMAQGTIRPWSERGFFMLFYSIFGLDALPFRICVFLTQFANIVLLASIVRRLAGSRWAGFWAALFWIVNMSQAQIMTWSAVYNESLCAFFLLLAFHFFLREMETGRRRYYWLQWAAFLLGFGALELNIVYPALAGGYALLCARKFFRRTIPFFAVSALYFVVHKIAAPLPASGVYAMHFDGAIPFTLWTYWTWVLGPAWLASIIPIEAWIVVSATAILTAAVLGFIAWRAWRGDRLPLWGLLWFFATIAPVLPLRDHITEYYVFLPAIGISIVGATAMIRAWRTPALVCAVLYIAASAPGAYMSSEWLYARSRRIENLVLGVQEAHERHPGNVILLQGVDSSLFYAAINDHAFALVSGEQTYLTPGSDSGIELHPEWGNPADFIVPPVAALRGLDRNEVQVYDVRGERLRNITSKYAVIAAATFKDEPPRRIDAANPLLAGYLPSGWNPVEGNHRWMTGRGLVRIAGPQTAAEKLYLDAHCDVRQTQDSGQEVKVTVDGVPLAPAKIPPGDIWLHGAFALPAQTVGKSLVEISIEVNHIITVPEDGRKLGLAFGTIEVR